MAKYGVVLLVVAAIGANGCAWVFQERLPSNYKPRYQPRCSTSKGLVVLDGVLAALNGITAGALLAIDARTDQDDALLLGSIAWTLVHTASGLSGSRWAEQCREAQDAWDADDGHEREQRRHNERVRRDLDEVPSDPSAPPATVTVPSSPSPTTPRGFYCAGSPSLPKVGVCAREKDACVRAGSALAAAAPDLSRCTLVETAYCFDAGSGDAEDSCAPTLAVCTVQHDRAVADGARAGDCVETK